MRAFQATAAALFAATAATACAASEAEMQVLVPYGQMVTGPASLQGVAPALTKSLDMEVGDKLVSIGGRPMPTLGDALAGDGTNAKTIFTFSKANGTLYSAPQSRLVDAHGVFLFALMRPDDAYVGVAKHFGRDATFDGLNSAEFGSFSAAVARWKTAPSLIEVDAMFRAGDHCKRCFIKSIGLIDKAHNALLSAIPIEKAAWMVYPDAGAPVALRDIPPPTLMGSSTDSSANGNINGTYNDYGRYSQYNGSVTGSGHSYTYNDYDYSGQHAVELSNLFAARHNRDVVLTNDARQKFIDSRYGNLRTGTLSPGETMVGHIFYVAPEGFDGPYIFAVMGEKSASTIRFDNPGADAR